MNAQPDTEKRRASDSAPPRRSVLLVSPQFPPSGLAGVHRARHLAKHLPAHGWQPTVITLRQEDYEDALDDRLSALVPPTVEILRVPAIPKHMSRAIGIGDVGLRSYWSVHAAIRHRLSEKPPDLVFITGFPFYPMMMASMIQRHGVPVVLDFQDPWVSAWGADQPRLSKAGLAHRLAQWLEPRAVRASSGIMSVSTEQNRAMQRRYPELGDAHFCALPIGGDPDDYDTVALAQKADTKVLLYAGAFLPRSRAVFAAFFRALAQARAADAHRMAKTKFRFIGTAAVTDRRAAPVVMPIAQTHGVADLVEEIPWRLPYLDALGETRQAYANLLIGSDEPHYTASKIFPALMSGRPFLSIFHRQSSSFDILCRCGGGIALGFDDHGAPTALTPAIAAAITKLLDNGPQLGTIDQAMIEPYTASEIARRCAAFFDRILLSRSSESAAPGQHAQP